MTAKIVPKTILERKGARRMAEIPNEVLHFLELGKIESINLVEFLKVNQLKLVQSIFPDLELQKHISVIEDAFYDPKKRSAMEQIRIIAQILSEGGISEKKLDLLLHHPSDFARHYAAYIIGYQKNKSFSEKLNRVFPLADDYNPGVREIAWMALRDPLTQDLKKNIKCLSTWTLHNSQNIRRFASEVSRPRGVWCSHIEELKKNLKLGLPILEPLKKDAHVYVQNSVGNWLNDASKSDAHFVQTLCQIWLKETKHHPNTKKIVKRGLRTLIKE